MNLTLSKSHKVTLFAIAIMTAASNVGSWLYAPKRLEKVELQQVVDHDVLIRLETRVEEVNKKLDRNGIGNNIINKYQIYEQASTNTGSEFDTN